MQEINSPEIVIAIGEKVQENWRKIADENGIEINITGMPAISAFGFKHENPLELKTFLTQEMLKKGYLATVAFYASCAHEGYLDGYFNALNEVFGMIKKNIENGVAPSTYLQGPVCHSGFKRLT